MSLSDRFCRLVSRGNNFYCESDKSYKAFIIDNKRVGIIRADVVKQLQNYPEVFVIHSETEKDEGKVVLSPDLSTYSERSSTVANVLKDLRKKNVFKSLAKWRNEAEALSLSYDDQVIFGIWNSLRPSMPTLFGVKQCGVHINGYTNHPDKGMCMWVAQRAFTKPTWPGMMDQMAAGGLSAGEKILDCAKRECQEEASIPNDLLENITCVGCVSYMYEDERGIFPECLYVLDLELPPDFEPVNADGEVQGFQLVPIKEMKAKIVQENFKFNCGLVVLDFLIRHSIVTPDNEPHYFALVHRIRDPLF